MTYSLWIIFVVLAINYIAFLALIYVLIDRINRKLPEDQKIPFPGYVFWTVIREYRRMYPESRLYVAVWVTMGVLWICGVALIFSLGFFK